MIISKKKAPTSRGTCSSCRRLVKKGSQVYFISSRTMLPIRFCKKCFLEFRSEIDEVLAQTLHFCLTCKCLKQKSCTLLRSRVKNVNEETCNQWSDGTTERILEKSW